MAKVVRALQLAWPYGSTATERRANVRARVQELESADLIVLPEMWPVGFFRFDDYAAAAEPLHGPTLQTFAEVAREKACHLLTGSFVERGEDGRLHNTCVLLGPTGEPLLVYRKTHLFGYRSREPEILTPGTDLPVAETPLGRIAVSTCYDLRFPEVFRSFVDQGADMVLVPAAWPLSRVEHWRLLLRARAVENQLTVVGCNMAGVDGNATYGGGSAIIAADGTVLAEADAEGAVVSAEMDPSYTQHLRAEFPVLSDRVMTPGHMPIDPKKRKT